MICWRQGTCLAGVQTVSGDLTVCRDALRRPAVATDMRDPSKCQSWVMEQRELKLDVVPPLAKVACRNFDSPSASLHCKGQLKSQS